MQEISYKDLKPSGIIVSLSIESEVSAIIEFT